MQHGQVTAELLAAEKGAGFMIIVASRVMQTDVVLMETIGHAIDLAMPTDGRWPVPWNGRG